MAEQLVSSFKSRVGVPHPITAIALQPSDRGRFEVTVDGDLIYSKAATGQHADPDQIVALVRERLAQV